MHPFPSIEQFRNVIRNVKSNAQYIGRDENGDPVYDPSLAVPTIKFRGTVKLHGTNAGIVQIGDGPLEFQSRSRVLSYTSDNAGFYLWGQQNLSKIEDMVRMLSVHVHGWAPHESIKIYGEWCGGNIQKGVAINGLPMMFIIFAIKINDVWIDMDDPVVKTFCFEEELRIFPITYFDKYYIEIDFNHPELATNQMVAITEQVEAACPVGRYFGNVGVGEGVVWTPIDERFNSSQYWFKVKGEKHSASKVKTLAEVDVAAVQAVKDFVDYAVTENRMEQGLQWLINEEQKPFEMKSLGDFIRWVYNDILKEEMDVIVASGLDAKKLGSSVANAARPWYIKRFNND